LPRAKALIEEIRACTVCAASLAAGPRPVVQFSPTSRLVIIGQAPGSRVHESGVPWQDDSGDRLRDWAGLGPAEFYNPAAVALVPMGFCYPGKGNGGDLPPRPECAPLWHERVLTLLPADRLTLLVGTYAQASYLPARPKLSMTEAVSRHRAGVGSLAALPHPAWRSRLWMQKHSWFEAEVLPVLQDEVRRRLEAP